MKHRAIVFLVIIFLITLAGGLLIWRGVKNTKQAPTPKTNKKAKHAAPLPREILVQLDKSGFNPSEVTIKTGTAVRWENISGDRQTVNSDDYPTNQLHRELNFGVFNNGASFVYIFKAPGTYGYHNQFHPEQEGKVILIKE